MKKLLGFIVLAVLLCFGSLASAASVEKLIYDVNTSLDGPFKSDNLVATGRIKAALLEFGANGGALGVDLQPVYHLDDNEIGLTAGVYGRLFRGVEVYANKTIDVYHFGSNLDRNDITAGVRFVILDR